MTGRGSAIGASVACAVVLAAGLMALQGNGANGSPPIGRGARQPVTVTTFERTDSLAAAFLDRVRGADPVVCELASWAIQGRYGWGHHAMSFHAPGSRDPGVSETVRWVLDDAGDPVAVDVLSRGLRDADACVRRVSALKLGRNPDPAAPRALRTALADANEATRHAAAIGIGFTHEPAMTAELLAAIDDPAPVVREAVAWALGEIEDPVAIEPLVTLLASDSDPAVRRSAARALGEIE